MNNTLNHNITLRKTKEADLPQLFIFQADEQAAQMAAFVNENYLDEEIYMAKWKKLLADPSVNIYTILYDGKVAGSVSTYLMDGEPQITYGVGRDYWGKGIATEALRQFLLLSTRRPLYGRVAFDNQRSAKVLTNCGFVQTGTDSYYAHARGAEIGELVFRLD